MFSTKVSSNTLLFGCSMLPTVILLVCCSFPTSVTAFTSFSPESLSSSSSSTALRQQRQPTVSRSFVQLQDPIDGPLSVTPNSLDEYVSAVIPSLQSRLPSSFIESWPTWILDIDGTITRIPDASDDGFVSPTSIDEIWQPIDLEPPKMRLALGLHVRQGLVRHVMPALDMGYTSTSESNGGSSGGSVELYHRNRGLSSVPRAHTWVEFIPSSIEGWNEYRLCLSEKKPSTDDNGDDSKWSTLRISGENVLGEALERAITCLAESPPDELGDGSHFIHVVLGDCKADASNGEDDPIFLDCPNVGQEVRVTMIHDDDMEKDEENVDASSLPTMGLLQVAISATLAGSESENLPDAYKPLYFDTKLRRQTYQRFKERQEARNQSKGTGS